MIHNNQKAATVKSYISAIKVVLSDINTVVNEDKYLLQSLTKACKLQNDQVTIRLPIHKDMLNLVLKTTYSYFDMTGQHYLKWLYMSLFATTYYGLFRVGEVTDSGHTVKASHRNE